MLRHNKLMVKVPHTVRRPTGANYFLFYVDDLPILRREVENHCWEYYGIRLVILNELVLW